MCTTYTAATWKRQRNNSPSLPLRDRTAEQELTAAGVGVAVQLVRVTRANLRAHRASSRQLGTSSRSDRTVWRQQKTAHFVDVFEIRMIIQVWETQSAQPAQSRREYEHGMKAEVPQ